MLIFVRKVLDTDKKLHKEIGWDRMKKKWGEKTHKVTATTSNIITRMKKNKWKVNYLHFPNFSYTEHTEYE